MYWESGWWKQRSTVFCHYMLVLCPQAGTINREEENKKNEVLILIKFGTLISAEFLELGRKKSFVMGGVERAKLAV